MDLKNIFYLVLSLLVLHLIAAENKVSSLMGQDTMVPENSDAERGRAGSEDPLRKRWSSFSTWGKKRWSDFGTWGKRWSDFPTWGKRWAEFGTWGKRDAADPAPIDKRVWNQFITWGKRNWNLPTWGKRLSDDQQKEKKWNSLTTWGKRNDWRGFTSWGKRDIGKNMEKVLFAFDENGNNVLDTEEAAKLLAWLDMVSQESPRQQ